MIASGWGLRFWMIRSSLERFWMIGSGLGFRFWIREWFGFKVWQWFRFKDLEGVVRISGFG